MDDKGVIICTMNMFSLEVPLHLLYLGKMSEIGISSRDTLAADISAACEKYNIDDVILIGPEAEEYRSRIHTYILSKFGVRNLNIEVKKNV